MYALEAIKQLHLFVLSNVVTAIKLKVRHVTMAIQLTGMAVFQTVLFKTIMNVLVKVLLFVSRFVGMDE